eukprot:2692765-Amphidinium_carterae.1
MKGPAEVPHKTQRSNVLACQFVGGSPPAGEYIKQARRWVWLFEACCCSTVPRPSKYSNVGREPTETKQTNIIAHKLALRRAAVQAVQFWNEAELI